MQGDNPERISFVIKMTSDNIQYHPASIKMSHYRRFRVKWASFRCPLAGYSVLFITMNSMGNGRQNATMTVHASADQSNSYSIYTMSMPIEHDERIGYSSESDPYGWIDLPVGVNLRNLTFQAFPEGSYSGNAPAGFVTSANPVTFEMEFSC